MSQNLLFVCTGNICRSPIAEYLFKNQLQGDSNLNIKSAGIHALVSYPADGQAIKLMRSKNIDLSTHRAKQLDADMIKNSNLILTMTEDQKKYIENTYLGACGKVFRIGKWSEFDVMDPYRRPAIVFEQVYALLEKGIHDWYSKVLY